MNLISFLFFFIGVIIAIKESFWLGLAVAIVGPIAFVFAFMVVVYVFSLIGKAFSR